MANIIVSLKELREETERFIDAARRGKSFIVVRRSKPIFKISPPDEDAELWEEVIDFTNIKKGGVTLKELLSRI